MDPRILEVLFVRRRMIHLNSVTLLTICRIIAVPLQVIYIENEQISDTAIHEFIVIYTESDNGHICIFCP